MAMDKRAVAFAMHSAGKTYEEIGDILGVSRTMARNLVMQHRRDSAWATIAKTRPAFFELSAHARSGLMWAGLADYLTLDRDLKLMVNGMPAERNCRSEGLCSDLGLTRYEIAINIVRELEQADAGVPRQEYPDISRRPMISIPNVGRAVVMELRAYIGAAMLAAWPRLDAFLQLPRFAGDKG